MAGSTSRPEAASSPTATRMRSMRRPCRNRVPCAGRRKKLGGSHDEGAAMILVIDNYDSFTYNLVHYLDELGAQPRVWRNDALTVPEALGLRPEAVVLSPGPCTPNEAGICLDLIAAAPADLPILGVCLGHQAIGQAFGGEVVRAKTLMHGKTSAIRHVGAPLFTG